MRQLAIALLCLAASASAQSASAQTPATQPASTQTASTAAPVAIQIDSPNPLAPTSPSPAGSATTSPTSPPPRTAASSSASCMIYPPSPVYIRAHHLLTSGDGVAKLKWSSTNVFTLDASGKPVYNFTILDQIFDAYRDAGRPPHGRARLHAQRPRHRNHGL